VELLVPLTWPFEIDPVEATVNHHRHGPYIQLAQIGYKRAILQFDRDRTLQTAVKIALPSMAVPLRERTPRDEGIIRIALYFIRNIAMLAPPTSAPMDIDDRYLSGARHLPGDLEHSIEYRRRLCRAGRRHSRDTVFPA
jgi:replication fork protection complex subunit Tof1/Swi1